VKIGFESYMVCPCLIVFDFPTPLFPIACNTTHMANVAEQILFNESEGLELKLKTNAGLLFGFVYLDHARR